MDELNEVTARVAVAEFETRRAKAITDVRVSWMRFAATVLWMGALLAGALYVLATKKRISGTETFSFFLIYAFYSAWDKYQARESLRDLKLELERVKDSVREKS